MDGAALKEWPVDDISAVSKYRVGSTGKRPVTVPPRSPLIAPVSRLPAAAEDDEEDGIDA